MNHFMSGRLCSKCGNPVHTGVCPADADVVHTGTAAVVDVVQAPSTYIVTAEQLGKILGTQVGVAGQFRMRREELVAAINALPDWERKYVHDIETRCDLAGDVQTIADLRKQVRALELRFEEITHSSKEIPDDWKEGR